MSLTNIRLLTRQIGIIRVQGATLLLYPTILANAMKILGLANTCVANHSSCRARSEADADYTY
jgi:hypothetical protein